MIAHVEGKVVEKINTSVIVDVNGVGYEVQLAALDFDATDLGSEVKFYTYHHIREQAQELFGFSSLVSKKLFELLISVQGVGPKAALSILSLGEAEAIRGAIYNSDSSYLSKASGVGRRTADRIAVDLSDKVGVGDLSYRESTRNINANDEALEALIVLGYSLKDASLALEKVPTGLPTSERVTLALKGQK